MKRYACTVAVGLLLALVGSGTAAGGLPSVGDTQSGTQSVDFGDQTVGEQKNDADVTQAQGNGNVNVSPAISIFGDAETTNEQGSDNTAVAVVKQSNEATQTQSSSQSQSLDQNGGSCCGGQSQTGEQKTYFGDQTIDKQKNDADVTQAQGNGNVNFSPAVAVWGDASTRNSQGNDNTAVAIVKQSNEATQEQSSWQSQTLEQSGGGCCGGQSQTGEQKTRFGDQAIGEQKNDADVDQYQGNGNVNIAPAIAVWGDASTWNSQGNDNTAVAVVKQSNEATQSQSANQEQGLSQEGDSCCGQQHSCDCKPTYDKNAGYAEKERCCDGQSQTGEQKAYFGDQTVEKQKNEADVRQYQGNKNVNFSPAIAFPLRKSDSCSKELDGKCDGGVWHESDSGGASTWNSQGNDNTAVAVVGQSNEATQSQSASQGQSLAQDCCEEVMRL